MKQEPEQHICETCGSAADNYVMDTKQRFCLDCALGLPKGTIAARSAQPAKPESALPVPCPDCGGSGQVSDSATCFECKGDGYINLAGIAARAYATLEESHTNVCRRLQEAEGARDKEIAKQAALEARNAKLESALSGIANANWRTWEDGLNTPEEFVRWAKSISRATMGL